MALATSAAVLGAGCGGDDTNVGGSGGSGGNGGSGNNTTTSSHTGGNTNTGGNTSTGGHTSTGGNGAGGSTGCQTPADCNDNDECTTDLCNNGTCAHQDVNVDDNNLCTVDACEPQTGVTHDPVNVDDNNVCTDDTCDPQAGVQHTAVVVDDNDACTTDACDPAGGVTHMPVVTDDNNACTTDACDAVSGVSHTPISSDDMNVCTFDSCDPAIGPVHVGETVLFSEDFSDNSAGWTLGTEWQIGSATASNGGAYGADPAADHTASADNGVAGVVIGGNASTGVHGYYYLESPTINAVTANPADFVELRLWRWLNSDYANYMHNSVEVYDGATWQQIWVTGTFPGVQDSPPVGDGWFPMSFDVTPYSNANFRVRFGFDIGQAGVYTIGSWNVDDVSVVSTPVATDTDQCTTLSCDPVTGASETAYNINDNTACTTDACDPVRGVSHTALAGIDDFNACTVDACDAQTGTITHVPLAGIDDGNPCTVDACDQFSGQITHTPKTAALAETFANNNAGWTLGTTWGIGPAVASACGTYNGQDPGVDHTPTADNGVAGVAIGGCVGSAQVANPVVCLTSPVMNLTSEAGNVSFNYWRHLHSDYTPYAVHTIDVYNGGSWVNVFSGTASPGTNDLAWTAQSFDVTAYKNANFQVRFCYDLTSGVFTVADWSVDDVTVYDPACVSPL